MRYMKNTVERIKLRAMPNEMHHKFNEDVITCIKSYPRYIEFGLGRCIDKYIPIFADETEALDIIRKSQLSRERALENKERMAELRVKTDECYRDIVMCLEYSMKIGSFTSDMLTFLKELNELIKSYKDVLAHRKPKHRKTHGDNNNTDENTDELETNG